MAIQIDKKIVAYKVGGSDAAEDAADVTSTAAAVEPKEEDNVVQLHEKLMRPEMLIGSTYKAVSYTHLTLPTSSVMGGWRWSRGD